MQRIQSLWFFLAALINGLLFLPGTILYSYTVPEGFTGGVVQYLTVTNFYPLLIIAAVITLLPLAAIFMFNHRKRQRSMAAFAIVACIGFLSVMMMRIANINDRLPSPSDQQYGIFGSLIPVAAIIFLILAIRGVRRDEKLLRDSYDRLR